MSDDQRRYSDDIHRRSRADSSDSRLSVGDITRRASDSSTASGGGKTILLTRPRSRSRSRSVSPQPLALSRESSTESPSFNLDPPLQEIRTQSLSPIPSTPQTPTEELLPTLSLPPGEFPPKDVLPISEKLPSPSPTPPPQQSSSPPAQKSSPLQPSPTPSPSSPHDSPEVRLRSSSTPPSSNNEEADYHDQTENTSLVGELEQMQLETNSYEQMTPSVRKRATKTLKHVVKYINEIKSAKEYIPINEGDEKGKVPITKKMFHGVADPEVSAMKYPSFVEPPPLTENLKESSVIGSVMSRKFLLPGMPKILGDIWVFIELFITIFQLIFSLVNTQFSTNRLFNTIYIALASTNTILACIDTFLYYYELRSCKFCYRKCKGLDPEEEMEEDDKEAQTISLCPCFSCCHLQSKLAKLFMQWFEVIRTILGELLIYPLVVLDLFELLGGGTFHLSNVQSRVSFSMFLVGSFYLILSVYVARTLMSITTIRSIRGITSMTSNSSSYTTVFVRFLVHVIGQVFVHLLCVVSVGIKIWQEDKSIHGGTYIATPFLWAVIAGGWSLPFMGVISYFVVNYYWLQSFSIGLFIDMIGLLEEPDFAEVAFQGKNTMAKDANEKAKKLLEDVNYYDVKREAKLREEKTNTIAKLVYPLKVPLFIVYGIVYDIILCGFIACLLLDYDKDKNVTVIDLTSSTGIATLIAIVFIIISNIHVILVINFWMIIIIIVLFLTTISSPIFIVIAAIICIKKMKARQSRETADSPLLLN